MKDEVKIAVMATNIEHLKEEFSQFKKEFHDFVESFKNGYVTKKEYVNLEEKVYELLSLKNWALRIILGAIIIAVLATIGVYAK